MRHLKLKAAKALEVLQNNVDLLTSFLLVLGIGYIFFARWYDESWGMLIDLFFLIGMAFHLGSSVANAIYRRRVKQLHQDQVEREAQMLERFRATVTGMMRVNK